MPILRRDLLKRTAAGAMGFTLSDFAQSRTEIDVEEIAYGVEHDDKLDADLPIWNETVDVVIVGSGGAGLSAALSAHDHGAGKILVVEKEPVAGGNTRFSGGYFNAVDPERQKSQGIDDDIEKHVRQTIEGGRSRGKPELVRILCEGALPTLHWLEHLGVRWEPTCTLLHGGLFPRGHVPTVETLRTGCIDLLLQHCRDRGIEVRCGTPLLRLIRRNSEKLRAGPVEGIVVACSDGTGESTIRARKGVILAAGGYAANAAMCAAFDPRLAGLPTTNHPGATGEVMLAAREIGAFLSGCDFIECLPLDARYSRLSLFVERCIFVDRTGRRFIREDAPRDRFRDKILDLPQREAFVILDDDGFRSHPETFRRDAAEGLDKGEVFRADSLQGLARQIRVPAINLEETVERYNRFVETRSDRDFGRAPESLLHPMVKPPFWASKANLSLHYTLGGVEIDERTRVLDWDGRPIPKLFAAGEITTGVHGESRLGGNSVTEIYVFGRLAGRVAAETPGEEMNKPDKGDSFEMGRYA